MKKLKITFITGDEKLINMDQTADVKTFIAKLLMPPVIETLKDKEYFPTAMVGKVDVVDAEATK